MNDIALEKKWDILKSFLGDQIELHKKLFKEHEHVGSWPNPTATMMHGCVHTYEEVLGYMMALDRGET